MDLRRLPARGVMITSLFSGNGANRLLNQKMFFDEVVDLFWGRGGEEISRRAAIYLLSQFA